MLGSPQPLGPSGGQKSSAWGKTQHSSLTFAEDT